MNLEEQKKWTLLSHVREFHFCQPLVSESLIITVAFDVPLITADVVDRRSQEL